MKKFISALMAAAMLITASLPVFAVDITMDNASVSGIFDKFEDYMPSDANDRIRIWKVFKAYMLDDAGIDLMIGAIEGTTTLPGTDDMSLVFKNFVDNVKAEYGEQFVLLLNLYKATDASARKVALDKFGSDPVADITFADGTVVYKEIEKTPLSLTTAEQDAANAIYKNYISDATATTFTDSHALEVANFLNLLTPFKGCFQMTNNKSGDLVLSSYKASFAKSLAKSMDYDKVNGVTIDKKNGLEAEGFDILTGIVAMFNTLDDENPDNLRTVLSNKSISLFKKNLDAATDPRDNDDDDDDSTGGQGGSAIGTGSGSGTSSKPHSTKKDNTGWTAKAPTDYDATKPVYNDMTKNDWFTPYVMKLSDEKIITGYEDGSFRPSNGITRQEIAVVMVRALGLSSDANQAANNNTGFTDDAQIADYARGYVNIAVAKKLFNGYDDGEFKPNKTITRQELVTVIMRLVNDTKTTPVLNFTDLADIHGYARDYVGKAAALGIVNGYEDGTFLPNNVVTRVEAAKMVYLGMSYNTYLNGN